MAHMAQASDRASPTGTLAGCRVLIVEDEYFLANDLEQLMKSLGATVVGPIADKSEAQHQIARNGFDVAVVDVNLRGELAYSLADDLINRQIPMAFATGYGADVLPLRFRSVKRWEKPFDASEISKDIKALCNQRRALLRPPTG
jgi:DNA-binding NtrC family response regulator